ncbi:hypothetical protein JJC03_12045 [Flavobacterium oreochromis]|uniref:tetratricopeptide repeat protein n=1 Tax=Flavobacterium oreochromis TaxID=2906078 RepID=UPI001CE664F1|nr:tetratricopeptide repeat protein [Flavobacterium oreochromis]QYS85822.1 hypothetical protein JJC03_12045 [Flavobacterium oreochromis]
MKKIIFAITFLSSVITFAQDKEILENALTPEQEKLFDKGIEKLNAKKYTEAIESLNKLISSNKKQISSYYYLAQAYFENKQYTDCVEACTKGLAIGPNENLLNYYRAKANIKLGEINSICEDVKKSEAKEEELLKYCH